MRRKKRRLFCEICPFTYKLSLCKCRLLRYLKNMTEKKKFAVEKSENKLPYVIYSQKSLMRRKLGKVDLQLQENKVVNLNLSVPKVSGILIKPGETFSFWKLVGNTTKRRGYKEGLTIASGIPSSGTGGGMCQFTNLIHWLVLHTPLDITEHHHHDGIDLFPDYGRQIPFGTGTSIFYNYLDYRFLNNTNQTFQLIVYTDETYLYGEVRSQLPLEVRYHIKAEDERFVRVEDAVIRKGKIYRETIDAKTGEIINRELIKENHARVMYEVDEDTISC